MENLANEMVEMQPTTKKVRIIVKDVFDKNGVLQDFKEYQIVREDLKGKLQRCKFKKDVEMSKFRGLRKFEVEVGYYNEAINYEYPVVWLSDIKYDTIKVIVKD